MTLTSTIKGIIGRPENDELLEVVYAKPDRGKFTENSEALILKLEEAEREWKTKMIAEKYCPDKEYFIEVAFLQEMLAGISGDSSAGEIEKRIKEIIVFVENDG